MKVPVSPACFGSSCVVLLTLVGLAPSPLPASPGEVKSHQKISDTAGAFTGTLNDDDFFGTSVASLGDLDGDGFGEPSATTTGQPTAKSTTADHRSRHLRRMGLRCGFPPRRSRPP